MLPRPAAAENSSEGKKHREPLIRDATHRKVEWQKKKKKVERRPPERGDGNDPKSWWSPARERRNRTASRCRTQRRWRRWRTRNDAPHSAGTRRHTSASAERSRRTERRETAVNESCRRNRNAGCFPRRPATLRSSASPHRRSVALLFLLLDGADR